MDERPIEGRPFFAPARLASSVAVQILEFEVEYPVREMDLHHRIEAQHRSVRPFTLYVERHPEAITVEVVFPPNHWSK